MTDLYLSVLKEHLKACEEDLKGRVLHTLTIKQEDLQLLAQIKGQILTLQEVSNPREFLLDEDLEKLDENIRSQSSIEDARN